ncbi:hypothetical protein FQN50_006623 [Emmonsiellopsis sp. PD_5]|nr:hypothetical protein FQN50_006623 [Emmonsiellopsis sp. PD_5]
MAGRSFICGYSKERLGTAGCGASVFTSWPISSKPSNLPASAFINPVRLQSESPYVNMTESGGFIKVPTDEEEEFMRKSAEESQKRREEARKQREMEEIMKKAGEDSQKRRNAGGGTAGRSN